MALVNDNTNQLSPIVQVFDFCWNLQVTILICLLSDNEINGATKRTQINHDFLHIQSIGIWIVTVFQRVLVTSFTSSSNIQKLNFLSTGRNYVFLWISEKKTAIISLHSIN
jgi:hypothetical protein